MRIIKIDSIATRYTKQDGTMLVTPELQLFKPYSKPGNGWFIGAFNLKAVDTFSVRSMFRTVKAD